MLRPRPACLAVLLLLILAGPAAACLWDYDTLRDEKRGLPGMAEVLAGQWERHSAFFYHHRVQAMRAKLAVHADDWDAADNLAVAYEKLDDRDTAIAVMLDKERRHPGQYTTAANLGTFYIHKGDLDAGIDWLKRALAINPDAHFGREEYQLRLAKFLGRARADPTVRDDDFLGLRHAPYVLASPDATEPTATRPDADQTDDLFLYGTNRSRMGELGVKPNVFDGLLGMVRFGTGTSPDLYFALGDVLAARGDKNLAVRAYRRALDLHYPRPAVVRHAIDTVAELQVAKGGLSPAVIEAERAAAGEWVTDYQRFEDALIRAGKDTDDEANYAAFYATHSRLLRTPDAFWSDVTFDRLTRDPRYAGAVLVVAVAAGVGSVLALRWANRNVRRLLRRDRAGVSGRVTAADS